MVTYFIIAVTALVSFAAFSNGELMRKFLFNAGAVSAYNQWYRFFSCGLIHADFMHLFFNMFVLYSFGSALENVYFGVLFGAHSGLVFALLYLSSLPASNLFSYFKHRHDYSYNALGASGAVSAIVFSCILISPMSGMYIMLIPFPVPSFIFGTLYLAYSWYMGKKGKDNVGHDAHFWGAVYGIVFTLVLKKELALSFIEQVRHFSL